MQTYKAIYAKTTTFPSERQGPTTQRRQKTMRNEQKEMFSANLIATATVLKVFSLHLQHPVGNATTKKIPAAARLFCCKIIQVPSESHQIFNLSALIPVR